MTTDQPDRLDRIEAIVESNANSTKALIDSIDSLAGKIDSLIETLSVDPLRQSKPANQGTGLASASR